MKPYFVAFLLLFCMGNIMAQNFNRISKDILKCHRSMKEYSIHSEQYFELRKETKIIEKLHNKQECDTIFLLEFDVECTDASLYMLGWNQSDTLYIYVDDYLGRKEFIDEVNDVFPKYMCQLVSKWDYEELKKEGKLHPGNVSVEFVFATRIIFNKKKYSIDCMCFEAFFKFDRDYIYRLSTKKDD